MVLRAVRLYKIMKRVNIEQNRDSRTNPQDSPTIRSSGGMEESAKYLKEAAMMKETHKACYS